MQIDRSGGGRNAPGSAQRLATLWRATVVVLRTRRAGRLLPVILYVCLALGATWPLARTPTAALPLGSAQVATVPLFNLWVIWWNADRLRHGFRDYWDAPIFRPEADTFAFSEPQPITALVAPVLWLSGSRALAFNIYLWLSLVLNGAFAERLLRLVGILPAIAIGGGAAMLLLPIIHWQLDVLQLVPVWGILWTWAALLQFSRRPSLARGALAGAAFAAAFWTCAHQGLLLAVLLAGAAWTLPREWRGSRTWFGGLAAVLVAAGLVVPFAKPFQRSIARHDFRRPANVVAQLSAKPGDYTAVPGRRLIDFGAAGDRPFWTLSPGWIKLILAGAGAAYGLRRRRWRRWTAFLSVMLALAFLLSLGTNLHIGSWVPWQSLTRICPGLAQVRNVFRFAFFVQMIVVLLAAQALHVLFLSRCGARLGWARAVRVLASLLGIAALVETLPSAPHVANVPDAGANAGWIAFVRENTPPGQAIACLPFATADSVAGYEPTTRWMYFGTFHGVPLVNGYSGFFPSGHFRIRAAVNTALLSEATLRRLYEAGARFLVIRGSEMTVAIPGEGTYGRLRIRRAFEDGSGVDIYRLEPVGP